MQLLYTVATLFRRDGVVRSQAAVGIAGVLIVGLGISSGLGLCALIGVPFNAITSQVVPQFILGIGVNSMYLLVHNYAEIIAGEGVDREVSHTVRRTDAKTAVSLRSPLIYPEPMLR